MRRPSANGIATEYWLSALFLIALLVTNRYLSLPEDAQWVRFAGGDSYSYLTIAEAFPAFPDVALPRHHSQRFFFPYVLGGVARLVRVPVQTVFRPFVVVAIVGIVLTFHAILDRLGLDSAKKTILLSFLILNAYVFRYHLALPWMISDVGFQLGLAVLLLGLLRESPRATFAGLLLAVLGKQTALVLIPGVIAWIWWVWRPGPRMIRLAQCAGVVLIGPALYEGTTWLVRSFSGPSVVVRHVTGVFGWLAESPSLSGGVGFAARGLIGFAFPAALLLALWVGGKLAPAWYQNPKFLLPLVLTASVCLQPLLGGPAVTGHSVVRLTMLGYLPLLVGLGSLLAETPLPPRFECRLAFVSAFSAAIGSFHHVYSFLGELDVGRAGRFAAVYVTAAGLVFLGSLVSQRLENTPRG